MVANALPIEAIRIVPSVDSWREAILEVGRLLEVSGRTTSEYSVEMLAAIESHGPYIVSAPGIGLAHARPSPAVLETGLALLRIDAGVNFGSRNDPVKLLFGFAAYDNSSHIGLIKELANYLTQPAIVNSLLHAEDEAAIRSILGA
jgi:PTS system ascorbate-specific IIA component